MGHRVIEWRGWEVVRLESADLTVDVVPGKGGDILAARWRGTDVLWSSPWGLRHRGARSPIGNGEALLMDGYPGGWQTVFPNAGSDSQEYGTVWGMHGEAWLASYDWERTGPDEIVLETRLVRSPFELRRRIRVDGGRLVVTETARNAGGVPVEAAWGHHLTFGAPFLGASCRLEAPEGATFLADSERGNDFGDLAAGARSTWPYADAADPGAPPVDLRVVPGPEESVARLGYLLDLPGGSGPCVSLTNARLGLRARLSWDRTAMPYAWLWYEMHATPVFPWYKGVYVLGVEPHSSYPGLGLGVIRERTGTQLTFGPGEAKTATTTLELDPVD